MNTLNKTLSMLVLAALGAMQAFAGATLTLGTYNIRYRTLADKTDDPATNKYWDARADNVARTIRDAGYQVVGLNELTDDNRHDGHTMLQDMQRNFPAPEWGFVMEDNKPTHAASTVHAVMYRTDVVEEMTHGRFWLAPDITAYHDDVYDSQNFGRMTLWVKFRVKATGEIFYFFQTHLHHQGNMAKNEGARINIEQMRRIAGGYPVFICGDHNSTETRVPFYALYDAYLDDSRKVAAEVSGQTGTCNVWSGKSLSRLDYVWVRGARVLSYATVENKYDRDFYPSDHFPLVVKVSLEPARKVRVRYVSASAGEAGAGTAASPFGSLQQALDLSADGDTIRVAAGTYYPTYTTADRNPYTTFNVTRSVTIEGGYGEDFAAVTGRSVFSGDLDGDGVAGEGDAAHVFTVAPEAALELSDAVVTGGFSRGANGAGIYCRGPRLCLDRVQVSGNSSRAMGAGVYAYGQLIAHNCTFSDNETTGNGGAIYADYNNSAMWWRHEVTDCRFTSNKALGGSAIYIAGTMWANISGCTFDRNECTARGTVTLAGNKIDAVASLCNNTFVYNRMVATAASALGGSAILVLNMKTDGGADSPAASVALANNTITANECVYSDGVAVPDAFRGAAVNVTSAVTVYLNNNIIAGNRSAGPVADVYLAEPASLVKAYSTCNLFSCAASINFGKEYSDIYAADASRVPAYLAAALDGSVADDGTFAPRLADNGGPVPTVRMVSPSFAGKDLNCIKLTHLREDFLMADVDADRQLHKSLLATDQRGMPRDQANKACIGAYEWSADGPAAAIADIVTDADGSAPVEYYNLQGIRVAGPDRGIYIRRQGRKVEKIAVF